MTQRLAGEPQKLITVFGGSGFIGRYVVRLLAQKGYRVRVAVRRPDLAGFLLPDGAVGQIGLVQANVRYADSVKRAVAGSDAVINLVGILSPFGRQTFEGVQAFGAKAIAKAVAEVGIGNLVHISAIGANAKSKSAYARTKAAGEAAVREAVPGAVILRPSIVFGPEDGFFNMFGAFAAAFPVLPLIGGGKTRFQPVYVGDLATAIVNAVEGKAKAGETYEIGGGEVKSFRELLETLLEVSQRKRLLINIPFCWAALQARLVGWLPKAPITLDQVELLKSDNVVSEAAKSARLTLEGLGVKPTALAAVLPTYLYRFRPHGQYDAFRDA